MTLNISDPTGRFGSRRPQKQNTNPDQNKSRSDQIRSDQTRSDQIKRDQSRPDQIRWPLPRPRPVLPKVARPRDQALIHLDGEHASPRPTLTTQRAYAQRLYIYTYIFSRLFNASTLCLTPVAVNRRSIFACLRYKVFLLS